MVDLRIGVFIRACGFRKSIEIRNPEKNAGVAGSGEFSAVAKQNTSRDTSLLGEEEKTPTHSAKLALGCPRMHGNAFKRSHYNKLALVYYHRPDWQGPSPSLRPAAVCSVDHMTGQHYTRI